MEWVQQLHNLLASQPEGLASAEKVLAELGCPSASIAVLNHGKITSSCLSTVGDDPDTVFQAASISKPTGGTAAMRLVRLGKLKLDAPITDYLSDSILNILASDRTRHLLKFVKVRHLLSHTAGLTVHGFPGYPDHENIPTVEQILAGLPPTNSCHVKLAGLPGQTFCYSGGGMTVLQLILEVVAGKPYAELMKELVFDPLEMTNSFYHKPLPGQKFAKAHYTGYLPCESQFHVQPELMAAGLWTTPTDLLKLVRAIQQSADATDGSGFLTPELVREMLTEIDDGMGLSWMVPQDPGTSFGHTGHNEPGFMCNVCGYIDLKRLTGRADSAAAPASTDIPSGCGVSVMTNAALGHFTISKLMAAIAYLHGWPRLNTRHNDYEIPFVLVDKRVQGWEPWKGAWKDGWRIEADGEDETQPVAVYRDLPPVKLLAGAMPSARCPEGESLDLVLEGLEVMLQLCWKEGARVVKLCEGNAAYTEILEREDAAK